MMPEKAIPCRRETVKKGLRSKGYNQGRFVVSKTESQVTEHGVHNFQKMVADALRTQHPKVKILSAIGGGRSEQAVRHAHFCFTAS